MFNITIEMDLSEDQAKDIVADNPELIAILAENPDLSAALEWTREFPDLGSFQDGMDEFFVMVGAEDV